MEKKKRSFFARLLGREGQLKDTEVLADAEVKEKKQEVRPTLAPTLGHLMLVLTEEQQMQYSEKEVEALEKKLMDFPPLEVGRFDLQAFEAFKHQGGFVVHVFFRNARELQEVIRFTEIPLSLYDATGEKVASGVFKMSNFGELKFGEARLWTFTFSVDQVMKQHPDFSKVRVDFV
jgi:SLAP domain-containing protein